MNKEYRQWWIYEGSGMRPLPEEDMEEFAMRIAGIAWSNGAYKEREACAKVTEDVWMAFSHASVSHDAINPFPELKFAATAIRARGEA